MEVPKSGGYDGYAGSSLVGDSLLAERGKTKDVLTVRRLGRRAQRWSEPSV